MAQRKRNETSFEDSLQKLEAIVKRLEEEEIPLESSLKLFAEGQMLARACEEQLKAAENQIRMLLEKNSGEIEETDFNTDAAEADNGEDQDEAGDTGEA
jgi:exodeoxyribonuclease VII small subunit